MADDLQNQSATSTRKMQEEVIKAQENYEAISAELETLQGKLDELEAELEETKVAVNKKVLVERCCQAWQLAQGGCDAMQ
eukprot:COSAG04_NODE_576_length_12493_cov_23.368323_7_plen_80_part_00